MTTWDDLGIRFPHLAGKRKGMVVCPTHADGKASLSLRVEPNGRVSGYCFAGCAREDWQRALGLDRQRRAAPPGLMTPSKPPRELVAQYHYRDFDGVVVAVKRRYAPKSFEWTSWDAEEQRQRPGLPATKYAGVPLYNMQGLIAASATGATVLVVEGEKSADRLIGLGYIATCAPEGASGAASAYAPERWAILAGATVALLPDHDAPGAAHMTRIAEALIPIARHVSRVTLPDLPAKGDVVDWLDAGHTPSALPYYLANAVALSGDDDGLGLDAYDLDERAGMLLDSGVPLADADRLARVQVRQRANRSTALLSRAERLALVSDPDTAAILRELSRRGA